MAHEILINGRRLDPKDATRTLLPSDTLLACPHCESRAVGTADVKLHVRLPGENKIMVPRMQDRWCHDCGQRWATVLPPEFQAVKHPIITGG